MESSSNNEYDNYGLPPLLFDDRTDEDVLKSYEYDYYYGGGDGEEDQLL